MGLVLPGLGVVVAGARGQAGGVVEGVGGRGPLVPAGGGEGGTAGVGALELGAGGEGLHGAGHGALEGGPAERGRGGVLALGAADLAARVAAVAAQGEVAAGEVVHAQVEELDGGAAAAGDDGVDAQVHVAIRGEVVVAYGQAVHAGEELGKVPGGGGTGVGLGEFMVVGGQRWYRVERGFFFRL